MANYVSCSYWSKFIIPMNDKKVCDKYGNMCTKPTDVECDFLEQENTSATLMSGTEKEE